MQSIVRNFTGGLNLDDQDYRVAENQYTDALNITRDSIGDGQDGVVSNILGNRLVANALPNGRNKTIGRYSDKVKNRLYFFNWNSQGFHGIYYYDQDLLSVVKILLNITDTDGIDILKFNPSYKITSINILYRDNSEGDLLFFNDGGINEPRVLNIQGNFGTSWKQEYISLAKAPPKMPLKPVYENEAGATIINNTVLNLSKINRSIFFYGVTTQTVSFDTFSSTDFNKNLENTRFTYIGSSANISLNVALDFEYSFPSGTVTAYIYKNGIAIPESLQEFRSGFGGGSYNKSVNITISTNDVIYIELSITNSISYPTYYFSLRGGTFSGVIQSISSNSKVTVNNLRNTLFQFRYRYVYVDFEKTVWSSASIIPLPNQPTGQLTFNTVTNNSRISLSFSTGNKQVKAIEIAFRKFSNGLTSDWQLIDKLDKSKLFINDNDIYNYKFYNDGIYNTIDILDTEKLQDYVPQLANCGELLNGNTPIYGGITEGYDYVNSDISQITELNTNGFFYDYNGLLFFATINGDDSGGNGKIMKVLVYGTGTNGSINNEVEVLNNGKATFVIDAVDGSNNPIGTTYTGVDSQSVSTLLSSISSSLVVNGWTQVSLIGNILTLSFPTNVTLNCSGTKLISTTLNESTTSLANVFEGSYQVGVMYFDSKGRTNGVITNTIAKYNTPKNTVVNYCQPKIIIKHRPPTWATYYQLVRSNNTTYNKRLFWVSDAAYSNTISSVPTQQYAYIGISNIDYYNQQINATQNVVNYNFTSGDRVRFLLRYNGAGVSTAINIFDYEVLGIETDPNIGGVIKQGKFVKIYYPTADISSTFKFDGTVDFQNYQILLYNYTQDKTVENKVFYEFGKCFGVGNQGTITAYHIGLDQTQDPLNPTTTPAIIGISNGDLFYRKRIVPIGANYDFGSGNYTQTDSPANPAIWATVGAKVSNSPITTTNYIIATQTVQPATLNAGQYPTWFDNDCFFRNTSANDITIRVRATIPVTSAGLSTFGVWVKFAFNGGVTSQQILPTNAIMSATTTYQYELDVNVKVPANNKAFLLSQIKNETSVNVGYFNLRVDILNNVTIPIIESSFSDSYNIVTNSNGRPSVVDVNAKRLYYPVLVRFGQSYQADTSINGTNRFFFDNQDSYDRGFGDVQRLHVRDRYMKVYQKLKVGNVPILTQIVKDVTGNPLQANSDQLINKIQYYEGNFGIGDASDSLAWDNFADYFVDNYRGAICRLSQNGIEPLSIKYKTNAFFLKLLKSYRRSLNNGIVPADQTYMGDPSIYGVFEASTNRYIVALEEINRYSDPTTLVFSQPSYTVAFDENVNQFSSFYSYKPECLANLNTTLISFKNGEIWIHDNQNAYCNFYGTQYESYIEVVFNSSSIQKKTWLNISEFANTVWDCPSITSQMNTYGTTQQVSSIPAANFKTLESNYHSNFLRDTNSIGGLINGNPLKGNFLVVKLRKTNANQFFYINLVSVGYIDSPLTIK